MKKRAIIGKKTLSRINQDHFNGDVLGSISFSENLQRFIRKYPYFTQVFYDPTEGFWYIGAKQGRIWCGAKFLGALCFGYETHTFSYPTAVTDKFEDRTNQFWRCSAYFGRRMFPKWYYKSSNKNHSF